MFIGGGSDAHLYGPINQSLRALWEIRALDDPKGATIAISPHQCHVRALAGPLAQPLQALIDWDDTDILLDALSRAHHRVIRGEAGGAPGFVTKTCSFIGFCDVLFLGECGAMAIRSDAGLWCQAYQRGWPVTPPTLIEDAGSDVGFMVAAAMGPPWFTGLPYTLEAVRAAVQRAAAPSEIENVSVEWHPSDDLLLECSGEALCPLHAGNLRAWL